jgi:hypothetical protein
VISCTNPKWALELHSVNGLTPSRELGHKHAA